MADKPVAHKNYQTINERENYDNYDNFRTVERPKTLKR